MTGNWKHCSGDEPGSGKASGDPYVDCRFVSSDGYSSFVLRPDACFAEQQMIGCSVLITAQSWDRAGYTVLSPREWCLTDEVTCIISNQLLATEKWHELARVLAAWERDPSQEFSVDLSADKSVAIWICGEPRQDATNESQERFRFVYESKARCFDMSFFVDQTCIRLARQNAALVACGFGDDGRKGVDGVGRTGGSDGGSAVGVSLSQPASKPVSDLTPQDVHAALRRFFPSQNDYSPCDFAEELAELRDFGITTDGALHALLARHADEVLAIDREPLDDLHVKFYSMEYGEEVVVQRLRDGYWFAFPALLRIALELEFGDAYREYSDRRDGLIDGLN